MKGLLGQLEELAWNLPPGSFSPTTPDLLGDGERLPRAGVRGGGRDGCPPHRCGLDRQGEASGRSWEGITPSPVHPQCSLPSPPSGGRCSLASGRGFGKSWHSSPGSHPAPRRGHSAAASSAGHLPASKLLVSFQVPCREPLLRHHRTLRGRGGGAAPCPSPSPEFPVTGVGGGQGLGAGPRGAFSAPEPSLLFQMTLEHRSQSCPATGNDTPVVQLLWAQSGTWWPAFLSFVHNKSYSLGPLCLLTVTPIATAPSLSTPTP